MINFVIYLLLCLDPNPPKLLFFNNSFILFFRRLGLRFSILRFHLNNLRWSIKATGFPKLNLTIDPGKNFIHSLFIPQVHLFDHTGTIFYFKQLKLIDNLLNVKTLIFIVDNNRRNILKLFPLPNNIKEKLFLLIQRQSRIQKVQQS